MLRGDKNQPSKIVFTVNLTSGHMKVGRGLLPHLSPQPHTLGSSALVGDSCVFKSRFPMLSPVDILGGIIVVGAVLGILGCLAASLASNLLDASRNASLLPPPTL